MKNFEKPFLSTNSKKATSRFVIVNSSVGVDSEDREAIKELTEFYSLSLIRNPSYTVAAAPINQREVVISQGSFSLKEPFLFAVIFVSCNLIVYGVVSIFNKVKTGHFFLKKYLSEIDILLAYKKGELKMHQAITLLENIHSLSREKAFAFLTDNLTAFENEYEN